MFFIIKKCNSTYCILKGSFVKKKNQGKENVNTKYKNT